MGVLSLEAWIACDARGSARLFRSAIYYVQRYKATNKPPSPNINMFRFLSCLCTSYIESPCSVCARPSQVSIKVGTHLTSQLHLLGRRHRLRVRRWHAESFPPRRLLLLPAARYEAHRLPIDISVITFNRIIVVFCATGASMTLSAGSFLLAPSTPTGTTQSVVQRVFLEHLVGLYGGGDNLYQ